MNHPYEPLGAREDFPICMESLTRLTRTAAKSQVVYALNPWEKFYVLYPNMPVESD